MSNVFAERFCILYKESGVRTIQKFADMIGLSRQTCDTYIGSQKKRQNPLSDDRLPDGNTLLKVSRYFGVSVDWLLGLTPEDKRNPSAEVKDAVTTLGISEKAIEWIIDPAIYGRYKDVISHLFEDRNFGSVLLRYSTFLKIIEHYHLYAVQDAYTISENGTMTLLPGSAADFFINQTVDSLRSMLVQEKFEHMDNPASSDEETNF